MTKGRIPFLAIALLLCLYGCDPQPSNSTDSATNEELLTEWKVFYEHHTELITSRTYEEYQEYIPPDFLSVKADGTELDRKAALKEVSEMFKAKSITGKETVLEVTVIGKEILVGVVADFTLDYGDGKEAKFHSKGTDVWKFDGEKWFMIKRIDMPVATEDPKE